MATKQIIEKGFFAFTGLDGNLHRLSLQEKLFCEDFLNLKGNGTEAAFNNYECKNYNVASAIAYENLRKLKIIAYIDSKLEEYGFNDEHVGKQHLFTLNQFADLAQKNRAIDMYYKLKGLYAPEKKLIIHGDIVTLIDKLNKYEETTQ